MFPTAPDPFPFFSIEIEIKLNHGVWGAGGQQQGGRQATRAVVRGVLRQAGQAEADHRPVEGAEGRRQGGGEEAAFRHQHEASQDQQVWMAPQEQREA